MAFGNVDGTQYGVPVEVRPQVAGLVHPGGVRREGLRGADHARRLLRPHRGDGRQRRHAAVRRHRVGHGDRVAVHRLGRGADPAQRRASTTTTSGSPTRCRSTRPRSSRRSSRSVDLWNGEGMMYAAGGSIVATDFGDNAAAAGQRRLHDAPSSQLLRRLRRRGRRVRRRRGPVDTSTSRPTRASRRSRRRSRRGVPRRARGVGRDAVPRLARVHQRPPDRPRPRVGGLSGFLSANSTPIRTCSTRLRRVPRDPATGDAGRLRRLRPDAGRGRVGHVLVGGHLVRQRRRHRPGGGRQHRSSWPVNGHQEFRQRPASTAVAADVIQWRRSPSGGRRLARSHMCARRGRRWHH